KYLAYLQAPDKYVYENAKMEFKYSYTPYGPYVRDVYIFIHYPVDSNIVRSIFIIENPLPFDNCDENSITREDLLLNPNTEEVFTIIEKMMISLVFTNNKLLTDNKYLIVDLSGVGPGYDQEDLYVYNNT